MDKLNGNKKLATRNSNMNVEFLNTYIVYLPICDIPDIKSVSRNVKNKEISISWKFCLKVFAIM